MRPTILLIEPDARTRVIIKHHLLREGYTVADWPVACDLMTTLTYHRPDLVIVDELAQTYSGQPLIDLWNDIPDLNDTPVLIITALPSAQPTLPNRTHLLKPATRNALLNCVALLLPHRV